MFQGENQADKHTMNNIKRWREVPYDNGCACALDYVLVCHIDQGAS
jgi:hypothetical protein